MELYYACERIKQLYRDGVTDSHMWRKTLSSLDEAIESAYSADELEKCIVEDMNWELTVEHRIKILKKRYSMGNVTENFLLDYYGYMAAHLDPGDPEREEAKQQLAKIQTNSLSKGINGKNKSRE